MKPSRRRAIRSKPKRSLARRLLRAVLVLIGAFYACIAITLLALRYVDPPFTAVQVQRRIEASIAGRDYSVRYHPVPLSEISPHLQHAVIAAEDSRFFQHRGFDWKEIERVVTDEMEQGRLRGASTITQQLVKNLYLTTRGSLVRKAVEVTIVPPAEFVLGKQRILELYLNVVEWGPGVFGAEEAARYHYQVPAARVSREQAIRLAAVLPNPLRRRPARMDRYSVVIAERMSKMGW